MEVLGSHDDQCLGQHTSRGDCLVCPDPRCLTQHNGYPTSCVICPDRRCINHLSGRHVYCPGVYCSGHTLDPDTSDLYCITDVHAVWCGGINGTDCEARESCQLIEEFVIIWTHLQTEETNIYFRDEPVTDAADRATVQAELDRLWALKLDEDSHVDQIRAMVAALT